MKTLTSGAVVALALVVQSGATTIPYNSFIVLVQEADAVVSGHVANIESQYSPQHEIYTFVTLDQLKVISGSYQDSTLTLRFKGGQVGRDILHVDGSPTPNMDDSVVFFVLGNGRYMVPVVGWAQGAFRVVKDLTTGGQSMRDFDGNRVIGIQGGHVTRERLVAPEARIVGEPPAVQGASNQPEAGPGSPDSGKTAAAPQTAAQGAAVAPGVMSRFVPTMSRDAFVAAIQNAAAAQPRTAASGVRQLKSVSIGDFSIPVDNRDAATGAKALLRTVPALSTPTLPQRSETPQASDQR